MANRGIKVKSKLRKRDIGRVKITSRKVLSEQVELTINGVLKKVINDGFQKLLNVMIININMLHI
jgi:hypothetical protein